MFDIKRRFWAIVIIELVFLIGLAGYFQSIMVDGFPIMLKTIQLDPDDLFRGSYLDLDYEIEQYVSNKDDGVLIEDFSVGEEVLVYLEKKGKYWEIDFIGFPEEEEEVSSNNIYLKATVKSKRKNQLILDYGLNKVFVSRKKAEMYGFKTGTFDVKLKVDYNGKGVIEAVYYQGKKITPD